MVGGSSSNTGHLNVILPPADRDAGFAPTALDETQAEQPQRRPRRHRGQRRGRHGASATTRSSTATSPPPAPGSRSPGRAACSRLRRRPAIPNPEPARGAWTSTNMVRRDVTTKQTNEDPDAFGNDFVKGGTGRTTSTACSATTGSRATRRGRDRRRHGQDRGQPARPADRDSTDGIADPSPLNQFIAPQQPFLGSTINYTGMLKREVTLYAFNQSSPAHGGHRSRRRPRRRRQRLDPHRAGRGPRERQRRRRPHLARRQLHARPLRRRTRRRAGSRTTASTRAGAAAATTTSGVATAPTTSTSAESRSHDGRRVPGSLPGQRSGDVVPGRGRRGRRRTASIYAAGQLRRHRLHLRRLGSGHAAGQRGRQRPGHRRPPARLGRQLQRLLPLPVDLRRLGLDARDRAGRDRVPAGDVAGRRGDRRPPRPARRGFRETAIVFTNEQKDNTKPIHADTPAHFTCGPGTTVP